MLALVNTADTRFVELNDVPEPAAHDDEALVSVKSFSLNRGELSLLRTRPSGWRPGQDVAGNVVAAARNGSGPKVGDRVVGWVEQAGWAELAAVKTTRLAVVPDGVDFDVAATLPIAGLTALRTLRLGGPLLGRSVLITGADGGVGQFAVQLAARAGASVTAIAKSQSAGMLHGLGARHVASSMDDVDQPHDVILESVGGASLEGAIRVVAPHGTIVLFGNSSGEDAKIGLFQFFGHENARIVTSFSYAYPDDGSASTDLTLLLRLIADGSVKPVIASRESWRGFATAAEKLRDRKLAGKAIFHVD